ncbi:MAG: DUF1194 domain-containing protein [Hyphomicrobiaceae bacterium]|nr:DUF1194 domain-containing protein [Hyphomicrobiaceae bacterium]
MTIQSRACRSLIIALVVGLFGVAFNQASAQSTKGPRVDLELILAVDISMSMDVDEQRLQRQGYIAALRDPELHRAIATGPLRRIAITYFEWAGQQHRTVIVPWTMIDNAESANRIADSLDAAPISRNRFTSISGAMNFAHTLFASSPFVPSRRVLDISGDGPNNNGGPILEARAPLLRDDVTINGLPIVIKRGNSTFDIDDLDNYYRECVIGGPGAFVIPIKDQADFFIATRNKLLREIAGFDPPAQVIRAQLTTPAKPAYNCLIGEQLWQRYMDGRYPN